MTEQVPEKLGDEISGDGKKFFDSVAIDNLIEAVMELSAELWVTRDRLYVLERVLAEKDIDVAGAIEGWRPSEAEKAERATLREAMAARIFAGFARRAE